MYPPIFATCFADATCRELLGTAPMRLFPFSHAPQDSSEPYAVWQTISGQPQNYVNNTPDVDSMLIQIDVYALDEEAARTVAEAIRDTVEPVAHVVSWRGEQWEPTPDTFRYSFDVEWIVLRTGGTTQSRLTGQDIVLLTGQDGEYISGQAA